MPRVMNESSGLTEPPLHGNQGDRTPSTLGGQPLEATLAISREAGARGETIARQVGRRMGWDVYTREHLEFLAGHESHRERIAAEVPMELRIWVENQLDKLMTNRTLAGTIERDPLPRMLVQLAARGGTIFVGRGAGYLLPKRTTLHVRIVAPLENRIAYMAQYLRLTQTEAEEQVRKRDEMRIDFLGRTLNRRDGDSCDFDLVLNAAELGEDLCAELIQTALQAKRFRDFEEAAGFVEAV
jgi:cytidylate kinase